MGTTTKTFSPLSNGFIFAYTQWWIHVTRGWFRDKNERMPPPSNKFLHQTCTGLPNWNQDGCCWYQDTTAKQWVLILSLTEYDTLINWLTLQAQRETSSGLTNCWGVTVKAAPYTAVSNLASPTETCFEVEDGSRTPSTVTSLYLRYIELIWISSGPKQCNIASNLFKESSSALVRTWYE